MRVPVLNVTITITRYYGVSSSDSDGNSSKQSINNTEIESVKRLKFPLKCL